MSHAIKKEPAVQKGGTTSPSKSVEAAEQPFPYQEQFESLISQVEAILAEHKRRTETGGERLKAREWRNVFVDAIEKEEEEKETEKEKEKELPKDERTDQSDDEQEDSEGYDAYSLQLAETVRDMAEREKMEKEKEKEKEERDRYRQKTEWELRIEKELKSPMNPVLANRRVEQRKEEQREEEGYEGLGAEGEKGEEEEYENSEERELDSEGEKEEGEEEGYEGLASEGEKGEGYKGLASEGEKEEGYKGLDSIGDKEEEEGYEGLASKGEKEEEEEGYEGLASEGEKEEGYENSEDRELDTEEEQDNYYVQTYGESESSTEGTEDSYGYYDSTLPDSLGEKKKPPQSNSKTIAAYDSEDDDAEPLDNEAEILKHANTNWSSRFHTITDAIRGLTPNANVQFGMTLNYQLVELARDFVLTAETYGKIIISEVFLPDEQKTIRPVDIGGVAGGQKYIVRDTLFKFSLDLKGMYESNASAAKVAGHELKGVMAYFNCHIPDLHVPMMAIVDYRGFRLVAMSLLPINKDSLCYGSADAGKTVVNSNVDMAKKMKVAAKKLNLREHTIGCKPLSLGGNVNLCCAADVEGHYVDGKYYLLDLARVFPPTTPEKSLATGHLYQLMRPELVRLFNKPLCSDAYSGFIRYTPNVNELNREIDEATAFMKNVQIPTFAKTLVALVHAKYEYAFQTTLKTKPKTAEENNNKREKNKEKETLDPIKKLKDQPYLQYSKEESIWLYEVDMLLRDFQLKQFLHARGINMRYLGLVKKCLDDAYEKGKHNPTADLRAMIDARKFVFIEMCARTARKILDAKLRKRMRELKVPLEDPYRRLIIEYFHKIFCKTEKSKLYWTSQLKQKILKKFGSDALTIREAALDYCLKDFLAPISLDMMKTDEEEGENKERMRQDSKEAKQALAGQKDWYNKAQTWLPWGARGKSEADKEREEELKQLEKERKELEEKERIAKHKRKFQENGHIKNGLLLLLHRIKELTGISFTPSFEDELKMNRGIWRKKKMFRPLDVVSIGERVKHLGLMHHALGYIIKVEASKLGRSEKGKILMLEALKQFEKVLESNPSNKASLRNCAQVLMHLEDLGVFPYPEGYVPPKRGKDINRPAIQQAKEYLMRAVQSDPTDTHSLYQLAVLHHDIGDETSALKLTWLALLADLSHEIAWIRLVGLLDQFGYSEQGEKINSMYRQLRIALDWDN